MIKINQFDSSIVDVNGYLANVGQLLTDRDSVAMGGIFCSANISTELRLGEVLGAKCVLTSSGTTALLLSLEYARIIAKDRPIVLCISEFLYFSLVSVVNYHVSNGVKLQILYSDDDEVTVLPAEYIPDHYHIFLLTSHNNKSVNVADAIMNVPDTQRFVIEDRCLVFGTQQKYTPDVACYSFSNNKLVIAGEGGCISSDNDSFIEWARLRTFSGIVPLNNSNTFMYMGMYNITDMHSPFKCSMSALAGLLVNTSLDSLSKNIEKRVENYNYLLSNLTVSDNQLPSPDVPLFFSFALPTLLDRKSLKRFQLKCLRLGMQTHLGVLPFSFFQDGQIQKSTISLPVHSGLTAADLNNIVNITIRALSDED